MPAPSTRYDREKRFLMTAEDDYATRKLVVELAEDLGTRLVESQLDRVGLALIRHAAPQLRARFKGMTLKRPPNQDRQALQDYHQELCIAVYEAIQAAPHPSSTPGPAEGAERPPGLSRAARRRNRGERRAAGVAATAAASGLAAPAIRRPERRSWPLLKSSRKTAPRRCAGGPSSVKSWQIAQAAGRSRAPAPANVPPDPPASTGERRSPWCRARSPPSDHLLQVAGVATPR